MGVAGCGFHCYILTKKGRIWPALREASTPQILLTLYAAVSLRFGKFLISDPGVSLFGILPRLYLRCRGLAALVSGKESGLIWFKHVSVSSRMGLPFYPLPANTRPQAHRAESSLERGFVFLLYNYASLARGRRNPKKRHVGYKPTSFLAKKRYQKTENSR